MKNVTSIVRTLFITVVIAFFLLIWWSIYINGNFGFGGETPSREDRPSMQEVTSLLDDVTEGLPPADRNTERSNDVVRAASKVYANPTQATVNRLIQNVDSQKIWKERHIQEYKRHEYCYNQYELSIEKLGGFFPNTNIKEELHVSVRWSDSSSCRKSYLEHVNPEE